MEGNTHLESLQILTKTLSRSDNIDIIQKSLNRFNQSLLNSLKDIELYPHFMWDLISRLPSLFSEQTYYIKDAKKISIDTLLKIDWNFVLELNSYTKNMFSNLINCSSVFSDTIFSQDAEQSDVKEIKTETVINDSVVIAERVANEHSLTKLEKRNWLVSFLRFLKKYCLPNLLSVILFLVAPFYTDIYNETIKPAYYYREFSQIQQENANLQLRIINRSTPLYKGKKMRRQLTTLSEYEIVVVLDDSYGDIIKVQVYNTDYIGWVYKKYTSR